MAVEELIQGEFLVESAFFRWGEGTVLLEATDLPWIRAGAGNVIEPVLRGFRGHERSGRVKTGS
jgi:hypothetical protein